MPSFWIVFCLEQGTGKQVIGISFSVPDALVGASPKPQTTRLRGRSNAPFGTALSLPQVACFRTPRGKVRAEKDRPAGDGKAVLGYYMVASNL